MSQEIEAGKSCCSGHQGTVPAGNRSIDPLQKPISGIYTCPMHPEVISETPGDCPLCGMSLEPVVAGTQEQSDAEVERVARRLRWSAVFAIFVTMLSMGPMFGLPLPHGIAHGDPAAGWLEFMLATP